MLETFTIDTFTPHIGTQFRVRDEGLHIALELIEVNPYAERPTSGRIPFSIVFRGPGQPILPQRIYTLEHAAIGNFGLFVVPIGPDERGMRYEAVFT